MSLNDKKFGGDERYGELIQDWTDTEGIFHKGKRAFWEEDVKQFIKDLIDWSERHKGTLIAGYTFGEVVKELAGDDLIQKGQEK